MTSHAAHAIRTSQSNSSNSHSQLVRRNHRSHATGFGMCLLVALSFLTGCKPLTYVMNAFVDDRIPAQFELAKDSTVVVLVDDPNHLLGDPSLPRLVAGWATQTLNKELKKTKAIAPEKVIELEQKTGSDFANLPVDKIGREVGATQVIYVQVESAGISGDPGLYRPKAVVRVNVIDAATGQRLFPMTDHNNPDSDSRSISQRGVPVTSQLPYTTSNENPVGETAVLMHKLAQEIGVNVAQVFYRHHPAKVPGYMD